MTSISRRPRESGLSNVEPSNPSIHTMVPFVCFIIIISGPHQRWSRKAWSLTDKEVKSSSNKYPQSVHYLGTRNCGRTRFCNRRFIPHQSPKYAQNMPPTSSLSLHTCGTSRSLILHRLAAFPHKQWTVMIPHAWIWQIKNYLSMIYSVRMWPSGSQNFGLILRFWLSMEPMGQTMVPTSPRRDQAYIHTYIVIKLILEMIVHKYFPICIYVFTWDSILSCMALVI